MPVAHQVDELFLQASDMDSQNCVEASSGAERTAFHGRYLRDTFTAGPHAGVGGRSMALMTEVGGPS